MKEQPSSHILGHILREKGSGGTAPMKSVQKLLPKAVLPCSGEKKSVCTSDGKGGRSGGEKLNF